MRPFRPFVHSTLLLSVLPDFFVRLFCRPCSLSFLFVHSISLSSVLPVFAVQPFWRPCCCSFCLSFPFRPFCLFALPDFSVCPFNWPCCRPFRPSFPFRSFCLTFSVCPFSPSRPHLPSVLSGFRLRRSSRPTIFAPCGSRMHMRYLPIAFHAADIVGLSRR